MIAVRLPAATEKRLGLDPKWVDRPRRVARSPALPEDDIQRSCVEWVAWNVKRLPALEWLTHIPNGGKRSKGEAGKMKGLGVRKGVLDLVLFWPACGFVGLFVEMKTATGKADPDQLRWMAHLRATGWRVELCRSLADFTAVVESYLAPAG